MNSFRKNSVIMIFLTTLSSAINYLCQVALGHVMTVSSFGVINSLFSLILVLSVPGTSINMLTAKRVAQESADCKPSEHTIQTMIRLGLRIGALLVLCTALFSLPGGTMLHAHPVMLILTGIAVATGIFPYIISGAMAGRGAFLAAGFFSLIVPVCKTFGVIGAMFLPSELAQQITVMLAITVGNLLAVFLCRRILWPKDRSTPAKAEKEKSVLDAPTLWVMLANFIYLIFGNGDVFLVTLFLGSEQSGIYSASMLFGRILYFFTTALVSVLLPYVSRAASKDGAPDRVFKGAVLMTLAVCIVCFIPINLFPEAIITLVYGARYLPAVAFVPYSCLAAALVSLLNLELNYFIGIGAEKRITCHLAIALLCMVIGLGLFHQTVQQILLVLIVVLLGIFLAELPACLRQRRAL